LADNSLAESLAETQQLRRNLQQLAQGNANSGTPNATGCDDLQQPGDQRAPDIDSGRSSSSEAIVSVR